MTEFQERLADSIRAQWQISATQGYYMFGYGVDAVARHCVQGMREELLRLLRELPEQAATRSMDFGRGYALAVKDLADVIELL